MDKRYIIERVKSDLRNEVYDLMSHVGYHALEKDLTEGILNAHPLYSALRRYKNDKDVSSEEKEEHRTVFAYIIFKEMNDKLGGFHFDRYKSLSTGEIQNHQLGDIMDSIDFDDFLLNFNDFALAKQDAEFPEFEASHQQRNLEDSITTVIKQNKVTPAVARAIAQDVVDGLHLTEDYGYLQITEEAKKQLFETPGTPISPYVSLRKLQVVAGDEMCHVMLKRIDRSSDRFCYLVTNFGALIKGV